MFSYCANLGNVYLLVLEVAVVDLVGAVSPPRQLQPGERVDAALVCQACGRVLSAPEVGGQTKSKCISVSPNSSKEVPILIIKIKTQ